MQRTLRTTVLGLLVAGCAAKASTTQPTEPTLAAAPSPTPTPAAAEAGGTSHAPIPTTATGGPALDPAQVSEGRGWFCHEADLAPLYCERESSACEDHRKGLNPDKSPCQARAQAYCFTGIGMWCAEDEKTCLAARDSSEAMATGTAISGCARLE